MKRIEFTKAYTSITKLELFLIAKEYFISRGVSDDHLYTAIYKAHLEFRKRLSTCTELDDASSDFDPENAVGRPDFR